MNSFLMKSKRFTGKFFRVSRKIKKEIYLHCSNANTANEVFQNVLNDRPEIFWCDGNATSTEYSQSEGQSRYVVIEPNYLYEGEEKNNGIRRLNRQEPPVFLAFQTFQMNTKMIKVHLHLSHR